MKTFRTLLFLSLICSLFLVSCANGDGQTERPEVVLAMVASEADTDMEEAVQRFNESQQEYTARLEYILIETETNGYTSEQFDAAVERLKISLVTGKSDYDALWLDDSLLWSLDVQDLADLGIFEDLGRWLDREGGLERGDFFDMVLTAFTLNDTLFSLPAKFSVKCLYGDPDLLGNRTEWTLREFLDFAQEHPDMRLLNCVYPGFAILDLYRASQIRFVDTDQNGELVFQEKLLGDFLDFCKNCPSRQGERGLFYADINLDSAQQYRYIDTQPKCFLGYPSQNAQNGCMIIDDGSVSILSCSDCKEGAWAFLEFLLLQKADEGNTEDHFTSVRSTYPAMKDLFEKRMTEELSYQWARDENGEILKDESGEPLLKFWSVHDDFTYPPLTEEDVAFVRDFLLSARGAHLQIYAETEEAKILMEEIVPYFEGEKTLEDTVDIIKRRLMILYQEASGRPPQSTEDAPGTSIPS